MEVTLQWKTPESWARHVLGDVNALLSDHAHCELGAAAAAQALLNRRPGDGLLVERMGAHAVEELQHFRRVHRLLRERGAALQPPEKNPYVVGLHRTIAPARAASPRPRNTQAESGPQAGDGGMLDRLLVAALVERRSMERFELLAAADAGEVGALYAELGPSEAGHARLFLELALRLGKVSAVEERLKQLSQEEADLIQSLPSAPRIHSGPPPEGLG